MDRKGQGDCTDRTTSCRGGSSRYGDAPRSFFSAPVRPPMREGDPTEYSRPVPMSDRRSGPPNTRLGGFHCVLSSGLPVQSSLSEDLYFKFKRRRDLFPRSQSNPGRKDSALPKHESPSQDRSQQERPSGTMVRVQDQRQLIMIKDHLERISASVEVLSAKIHDLQNSKSAFLETRFNQSHADLEQRLDDLIAKSLANQSVQIKAETAAIFARSASELERKLQALLQDLPARNWQVLEDSPVTLSTSRDIFEEVVGISDIVVKRNHKTNPASTVTAGFSVRSLGDLL
ncbi:hypothetical protein NDN08_002041 [Rhodosorus marinus]|uniref:Uncharacterized protein n=1 Tax=Rhodosorus marinus TaxID=101924 RepID=A0AAV8USP2_9RHOD|nr:hypothetical protein NDN08_002041 [Rhodosorus marinus]